jgi:YjbE family integral membrane protein
MVEFLTALVSIIIMDLLLAGDNAIVIGMAARNVPKNQQKKAIFLGTLGAVFIRIIATLAIVSLLNIPGLLAIGGILLIWIAYKLFTEEEQHTIKAEKTMLAAIKTIVVADAAMGLDNVLAVGGAAHDHPSLVVFGLAISIPIIVCGSTIFIKLIERFPMFITIGAGILAWTAAKMITDEHLLRYIFVNDMMKYAFEFAIIAAVMIIGTFKKKIPQLYEQQLKRDSHLP